MKTVSKPTGKKTVSNEPTYTIDELAVSVYFKGVPKFAVKAALKNAGKTEFTVNEAKSTVFEYLKGEINNG